MSSPLSKAFSKYKVPSNKLHVCFNILSFVMVNMGIFVKHVASETVTRIHFVQRKFASNDEERQSDEVQHTQPRHGFKFLEMETY